MKNCKSPLNRSTVARMSVMAGIGIALAGCGGTNSITSGGNSARVLESAALSPMSVAGVPDLGPGASLHGKQVFPLDNAWNQRVDTMAVDPNSDKFVNSIGRTLHLHPDFGSNPAYGIPYTVVAGTQAKVPVSFDYASESDKGPYPFPANAPIEGGSSSTGDRHVLVIDRDNWKLYETYDSHYLGTKGWHAGSGAVFGLNSDALRPAGWTSADAAGLPIFPGLARYDEVVTSQKITHALRFTVPHTQHGYVSPARHFTGSSTDPALPPMGMRVRLKASYPIAATLPAEAKVILQAMKTYGMIVADNGSPWYFTGATDRRWNDDHLSALKTLTGDNFEVVKMGPITTK